MSPGGRAISTPLLTYEPQHPTPFLLPASFSPHLSESHLWALGSPFPSSNTVALKSQDVALGPLWSKQLGHWEGGS